MKTTAPDYYRRFVCKADQCGHTCCAGWEIDIDEETYEYYQGLGGETGRKLSASISADTTPHFILQGEEERCPMLDEKGLCRLITEYGKQALCQICADHPRFYNDYSDRTEIGLGLCCEAAGELILLKKERVRLLTLSDDGNDESASPRDSRLFRKRRRILALLQDRRFPVDERIERFLAFCGLRDKRSPDQLADLFLSLERLDETWTRLLLTLKEADCVGARDGDADAQILLEQFAVYLVYRYTPYLENQNAVLSISGIYRIFESLWTAHCGKNGKPEPEKAVEIARLLSCEVEYSDENIEFLFR